MRVLLDEDVTYHDIMYELHALQKMQHGLPKKRRPCRMTRAMRRHARLSC